MGRKLNPFELELYQRTDEVLHYVWDPIGVSAVPEARDEYHAYLSQVFSMLLERKGEAAIAEYLARVEVERMGLSAAPENAAHVATTLSSWQRVLWAKHKP